MKTTCGADGVEETDHLLEHDLVVDHAQVALLEAVVGPADGLRRRLPLAPANARDLVRCVLGRTAIAGRHRREVDRPAVFLAEPDQRAGTEKLGVVGVREDGDRGPVHGGLWSGSGREGRRHRPAARTFGASRRRGRRVSGPWGPEPVLVAGSAWRSAVSLLRSMPS